MLERDADGRGARVEYRVAGLGRSIHYVLEYDYAEAPRAFSWKLLEGDVLRRLDGRYGFEREGDGTRVTYDLVVDVAIPHAGHRQTPRRRDDHGYRPQGAQERGGEDMSEARRDDFEEPAVEYADPHTEGPGPAAPTAVESVVNAFLEAGPEVAEHVVRAAQELLLAAQAVVDAAQHAVEEQQTLRRTRDDDGSTGAGAQPASPTATVHRLDVAE